MAWKCRSAKHRSIGLKSTKVPFDDANACLTKRLMVLKLRLRRT
jgi:hypothetical protein